MHATVSADICLNNRACIDHRVKGNGNAVDIQRETILSTSVVHPNVVSVDLYPVSSTAGLPFKGRLQTAAHMQDDQACNLHPLAAYASVNDAKRLCMSELFLKGCSPVLITTECISIACVLTVSAYLHGYHRCTHQHEPWTCWGIQACIDL